MMAAHKTLMFGVIAMTMMASPAWTMLDDLSEDDACDISLKAPSVVEWTGTDGQGYNPFGTNRHLQAFQLKVSSGENDSRCEYAIVVQSNASGGQSAVVNGTTALAFDLMPSTNSNQSLVSSTPFGDDTTRIIGQFDEDSENVTQTIPLYIRFQDQQAAPAGQYSTNLTVTVYQDHNGGLREITSTSTRLDVSVQALAEVSFTANQFDSPQLTTQLDFQNDVYSGERTTTVYARANTDFQLEISSQNAGAMTPVNPEIQARLNYRLFVNNAPVNLDGPGTVITAAPSAGQTDLTLPLSVVMYNPRGEHPAGMYSDVINLRVVAN